MVNFSFLCVATLWETESDPDCVLCMLKTLSAGTSFLVKVGDTSTH